MKNSSTREGGGMADALGLEPSRGNSVGVQVPPLAISIGEFVPTRTNKPTSICALEGDLKGRERPIRE